MNQRLDREPLSLSRRSFLLKASFMLAAAAAFSTIAKTTTSAHREIHVGNGSMFTPKTGSRTKFWGRWLNQLRIR